jgi:chromosome segregation ATPase
VETKLKTLQTRMNLCEADLKVCEEKIAQLSQQQGLRDRHAADLKKELKATEKSVEKKQQKFAQLERTIREVEREVFRDFSARMGVENIRDFEESRLRHHKELITRKNEVAEQRATLQAQLEYELKRDFKGALKTHIGLMKSTEDEMKAQHVVVRELEAEVAQNRQASSVLSEKRDGLRKEKKDLEEQLRAMQVSPHAPCLCEVTYIYRTIPPYLIHLHILFHAFIIIIIYSFYLYFIHSKSGVTCRLSEKAFSRRYLPRRF